MIFEVLIIIDIFLGGCKEIKIQLAGELKNIVINFIAGEKICPSCEIELMSFKDDGPGEPACSRIYEDEDIELITCKFLKENFNSSFTSKNISPLHECCASQSRVALNKKKLLQSQQTVKLGVAKTLNEDVVQ